MIRTLTRRFAVAGKATVEGTRAFAERNPKVASSHWSTSYQGLTLSSLGIGTYIGAPDGETDELVTQAVLEVVRSGTVNVIDTAINYRYQKAERAVRKALQTLANEIPREQLFVCSKIGYIPEDADSGETSQDLIDKLKAQQLITRADVAGEVHCMHPAYLKQQLDCSLTNLGLETVDLMYLHNAAESQMPLVGEEEFWTRLTKAFEFFEEARAAGKIGLYGLATWLCFRSLPSEKQLHVNLERAVKLAESVGGSDHGMRYVQLPINIMMPEAFVQPWQEYQEEQTYLLNVAKALQVNIVASSPLMQGKLLELKLSKTIFGVEAQAGKHVQLIRSIPSEALKTVLLGMKNPRNVTSNVQVAFVHRMDKERFWNALKPEGREDAEIAIDLW